MLASRKTTAARRGSNQYRTRRGSPDADAVERSVTLVVTDEDPEVVAWLFAHSFDDLEAVDITGDLEPWFLRLAARHPRADVRGQVVRHPNCPLDLIVALARNPGQQDFYEVTWGVAENPNSPPEMLAEMAASDRVLWNEAAAKNPSTPPESLHALTTTEHRLTLFHLAANPSLPADDIDTMAAHDDFTVRGRAAVNPSISDATMDRLTQDAHWSVVNAARQGREHRRETRRVERFRR